jgi:hypothetical protein
VARAADAVGDITAGVAFRQQNASSQDVGAWTASNALRGNGIAAVIAVRPAAATLYGATASAYTFTKAVAATKKTFGVTATPLTFVKAVAGIGSKKTSVAEISLASHGTPTLRTNHSIKIRARTTSGSTGVIRAALYEGATNRSGDLSSSALTTSLANYTLICRSNYGALTQQGMRWSSKLLRHIWNFQKQLEQQHITAPPLWRSPLQKLLQELSKARRQPLLR